MTMELSESIERFEEGLKKAAARARELAKAQKYNKWMELAAQLDKIRAQGMSIIRAKALTRKEELVAVDRVQNVLRSRVENG